MTHDQLRDALEVLHDGELSPGEREEVLAHLKECADCRQKLERWGQIAGTLFRAPAKPTSQETELFVQCVMERLDGDESFAPAAWWNWLGARWMIPALSFAVAVIFFSIIQSPAETVAPMDSLFLISSPNRSIDQLVLPPDPSVTENLLSFLPEEG